MTIKQEQREAQTAVERVAEGVLRMQLPIAIPGLRHVNMYCFPDDRGATVIDPGLPDEANWIAVQDRLKQAGFEVRHVHTVLVTHSHPDHFGGAARRQIDHDHWRSGVVVGITGARQDGERKQSVRQQDSGAARSPPRQFRSRAARVQIQIGH